MSGISGGGVGINFSEAFRNQSTEQLQSQFVSKEDKQQLQEAAKNALDSLEKTLNEHSSESTKHQYVELAEKFAAVFPEDKAEIGHISTFAHNVLGIEKTISKAAQKVLAEAKPAPINYDTLDEGVSLEDTSEKLKEKPLGEVYLRKSGDKKSLVIAIQTGKAKSKYGVAQHKYAPGKTPNTFIDPKTKEEKTIEELVDMLKKEYDPKQNMQNVKDFQEAKQMIASYGDNIKMKDARSAEIAKPLIEGLINNTSIPSDERRQAFQEIFQHFDPNFMAWNPGKKEATILSDNQDNIRHLMNGELDKVPVKDLPGLIQNLEELDKFPLPDGVRDGVAKAKNQMKEQYKKGFDYKNALKNANDERDIAFHIKLGANRAEFINGARELAREMIFDDTLDELQLKNNLDQIFTAASAAGSFDTIEAQVAAREIAEKRDMIKSLLSDTPKEYSLQELKELRGVVKELSALPLPKEVEEAMHKGYLHHLEKEAKAFNEKLKTINFPSVPDTKSIPKGVEYKETVEQLKDKPPGEVSLRYSSDNKSLVIGVQTGKGGTNSGVVQVKYKPGATDGKFVHEGKEYSPEELVTKLQKEYSPNTQKWAEQQLSADLKNIRKLASRASAPIPTELQKTLSSKVLNHYKNKGSDSLNKVIEGKIAELSLDEIGKVVAEIDSFASLPVPEQLNNAIIANAVLDYVNSHQEEMAKDPTIATRAHHILHDLAQKEIANGNVKGAFEIEGKAASAIPLSAAHPLHNMDAAILQGTSKQYDARTGAFFSSLDTTILKGGNLHASQRKIDGELVNTFDFKISHYARDELTAHVNGILSNPEAFKASVPKELAAKVTIKQDVPQEFLRYDDGNKEFSRSGGYSPGGSTATEIVFEGVGKVIIGNNKENGSMYNRIQVEMNPNLPPGEGAKKLQQMLAVSGLGPVLGQQPPEADERMKMAQLFRAFYPRGATAMDTTKEFYQLSPADLRQKIIDKEPGMKAVFEKYLDSNPELMQKVEIMPGKEIWGVTDLGAQMKANGAWGLMTGVGNSGGWDSAQKAIVRVLTQGAMSSEQRFESGVFKEGASSEEDLLSGGGDQVFTRLVNNATGAFDVDNFPFYGNAQILWDLDSVAQRVPYAYDDDCYGVKNRFEEPGMHDYDDYLNRPSMLEFSKNATNAGNEVMVKNSLAPSHVAGIVVEDSTKKDELIKHLEAQNLAKKDPKDGFVYVEFAGKRVKADDFIHVGTQFEKGWWG